MLCEHRACIEKTANDTASMCRRSTAEKTLAVALAQHFVQDGRFPQQPLRVWLHVVQHAFLAAQQFGPQVGPHDEAFYLQ